MAMAEVFMSSLRRRYTDEFRAAAVKRAIERGFTVVAAASRIGIPRTYEGWPFPAVAMDLSSRQLGATAATMPATW
ncbi:transposase [Xanthomonas hyacinthi]|uniref:Transposase n=1 Tax=Xanthomonas hyacinthi TaxID=56455 RepID=A0A2S7ET19_9XANT|nr:hypothetical protein XhyaCFBP1156_15900 [Xanthomonas hyacinthi]QGY75485.1 transposase [Xanthomonas hyacinthi]